MRIWEGTNLWQINAVTSNVISKDDFKISKNSWLRTNFIENTQEFKDFKTNYENIYKRNLDIQESDVIYFLKESKYPRFKFSANCKNLKTIKIENADKIVIPDNLFNFQSYYYEVLIIQDTLTDNVYYVQKDYTKNYNAYFKQLQTIYNTNTVEDAIINLLQDKFLIQGTNYELIHAPLSIDARNSNFKLVNDIEKYYDKCITEENLEKYVSKDSVSLDNDLYSSIDTMLKSTDSATVELGIKMLSNFSIEKSSFKLGMLIRTNIDNIANNKAASSAGFKNVLTQLGINGINDIRYVDLLSYLNRLYDASKEDEDNKLLIREESVKEMLKRINNQFVAENRKISLLGLNINLDIF